MARAFPATASETWRCEDSWRFGEGQHRLPVFVVEAERAANEVVVEIPRLHGHPVQGLRAQSASILQASFDSTVVQMTIEENGG